MNRVKCCQTTSSRFIYLTALFLNTISAGWTNMYHTTDSATYMCVEGFLIKGGLLGALLYTYDTDLAISHGLPTPNSHYHLALSLVLKQELMESS